MNVWALIAERKILEAMEEGKFDGLCCRYRALPEEDFSAVPPDRRLGLKILRNAGVLPPEMELKKEIVRLRRLHEKAPPDQRRSLGKRLEDLRLQYNVMMERSR